MNTFYVQMTFFLCDRKLQPVFLCFYLVIFLLSSKVDTRLVSLVSPLASLRQWTNHGSSYTCLLGCWLGEVEGLAQWVIQYKIE